MTVHRYDGISLFYRAARDLWLSACTATHADTTRQVSQMLLCVRAFENVERHVSVRFFPCIIEQCWAHDSMGADLMHLCPLPFDVLSLRGSAFLFSGVSPLARPCPADCVTFDNVGCVRAPMPFGLGHSMFYERSQLVCSGRVAQRLARFIFV